MALTVAQRALLVAELSRCVAWLVELREMADLQAGVQAQLDAQIDRLIAVPAVRNMTGAERQSALKDAMRAYGMDVDLGPGLAGYAAQLQSDFAAAVQARVAL